jgi:hypothetical protein
MAKAKAKKLEAVLAENKQKFDQIKSVVLN